MIKEINFKINNLQDNLLLIDNKFEFDLILMFFGCDSKIKYKNEILKIKETLEKTINKHKNIKTIIV